MPVLILIGFTAAIAQIVLMRELMVVFCGNEISLGLMLGSWLFWTAAGSAIAGRVARVAGGLLLGEHGERLLTRGAFDDGVAAFA